MRGWPLLMIYICIAVVIGTLAIASCVEDFFIARAKIR